MSEKHYIIPIFIPHKGCPYDCIFCNQRKISGQIEEMTIEEMQNTIEAFLKTIKNHKTIEIGFYGGSFTGIEKEKQLAFLSKANEYIKSGKINGIRLSTRPDYIDNEILSYLKANNVNTIELGVQSLDDEILKISNRGHSSEDVYRAAELINASGIKLGIQTMTGLPGDTREKDLFTAQKVIEMKPCLVRIYPVLVIKGTYLHTLMRLGKYAPQTVNEAVDICSELLELYQNNGINVIRIGLQPSENISKESEVAAGPFHPAFRQLVESKLSFKKIEERIKSNYSNSITSLTIMTGPGNISNVCGQNRENVIAIKNKYSIKNVKIQADKNLNKEIEIIAY
jgi:Histone acetyltransferase